jgi:hypothetical protein
MIAVMMFRNAAPWAFLAAVIGPAVAQFDAWQDGQISTEICIWKQPRGKNIVSTYSQKLYLMSNQQL